MMPRTQWRPLNGQGSAGFQQPDAAAVQAQAGDVVGFCQQKFPHVADYLEEALDELLAFTCAPKTMLLRQHRPDQPNHRVPVRQRPPRLHSVRAIVTMVITSTASSGLLRWLSSADHVHTV